MRNNLSWGNVIERRKCISLLGDFAGEKEDVSFLFGNTPLGKKKNVSFLFGDILLGTDLYSHE